jgi:hypothetical protein
MFQKSYFDDSSNWNLWISLGHLQRTSIHKNIAVHTKNTETREVQATKMFGNIETLVRDDKYS